MSKLLNLEVANTVAQSAAANSAITLGNIVRKYCCCQQCTPTFSFVNGGQTITLNQPGYYSVDVHAVATVGAASTVTISLYNNNVVIPQASSSETFADASSSASETHTLSLSTIVRVLPNSPVALTLMNTGAAATIAPLDVKIIKIV